MLNLNVSGDITRITNALYNLPPFVAYRALGATGKALTEKILPDQSPPYSYVSRARAYPEVNGFFSERQRRFVMAAIRNGTIKIPYVRTGQLEASYAWTRKGYELSVTNLNDAAPFVIGDGTQSRHEKMVGWPTMSKIAVGAKPEIFHVFKMAADAATREFNDMPTASKAVAGRQ